MEDTSAVRPSWSAPQKTIVSSIVLLIVGMGLIGLGALFALTSDINWRWPKIDGRIVSYETKRTDGAQEYVTTVSYQVNGLRYQTVAQDAQADIPRVGALQKIAYNPDIPLQAVVVRPSLSATVSYLFPIMGMVIILLALLLFVRYRKRSQQSQIQTDGRISHLEDNVQQKRS